MSRVGVLEFSQKIHEPTPHLVSRKYATRLVDECMAVWRNKKLIQLTRRENWGSVKIYCGQIRAGVVIIPQILPPLAPTNLVLYYPVRDMSSYGQRNFQQLWNSQAMIPTKMRDQEKVNL
jgi:hypothetical protein